MTRYFTLISHHLPERRDSFYFDVQKADCFLSIGWGEVNPIGSDVNKIRRELELYYADNEPLNITNGVHSLSEFASLKVGDIVFIRGNSLIVDTVIITGEPFYMYGNGHDNGIDYCTKARFTSLFDGLRLSLPVAEIPEPHRGEFLYHEGRSRPMKELDVGLARVLIQRLR